jgi:hypothetical protein
VNEWLTEALLSSAADLPEEVEGYILGRGLRFGWMEEMHIGLWSPPSDSAPGEGFRKRHGSRGQYQAGWLSVPYWSPRGLLLGVEFRTWDAPEKKVRDYRMPSSVFSPVFLGLTPSVFGKIWTGGDIWLVEGVFDIALGQVVPEKDVVLGCGTARLVRSQLNFILRFLDPTAMVHVVFDEDETGRKQLTGFTDEKTGRWIPGVIARLERVGVRCRAVRYRGGKDPGEIWENGGKAALSRAFKL